MLLKSTFLRLLCALLIAAALPVPQALANDDGPVTYRVVKGDTLYDLAQQYFTSRAAAREVQRINLIRNPRRIPINKPLRIPRKLLRYQPVTLTVTDFSGPVTVNGQAARKSAPLGEAQLVSTGPNGFVSFSTNFGGRFTMPSNSTMRLSRARRYLLNDILDVDFDIVSGRGTTKSPKLKDQDRLRMRTPVATTAVRGTEYRVAYREEDGRSLAEVLEGSVNVAVGEESADTGAGFGLASSRAGLGTQEALLPATRFDKPDIQTGETLAFSFLPLDKAQAYRVQIAKDQGFLDVLSETIVNTGSVTFAGIDDGRYAVRVRGISASGIEGVNSLAQSFRRKRLGVSGSSERSELLDGFLFKWAVVGEGTKTFAFQLWKDGNAQDLLIDETGLTKTSMTLTDLEPGTYQWRVAVMQADAEDGLIRVWGETMGLVVSG